MASGCHKCGGYPGHASKNRAFLVECMQCGTYTCNNHLTIMGNCPNCQSGKVKKVMTQRDAKQAKRGGMPGKGGVTKNTGNKGNDNRSTIRQGSDGPEGAGGGGIAFARGGTEVPQNSGGNPGLQYNPADLTPENVKNLTFAVLNDDKIAHEGFKVDGVASLELNQLSVSDLTANNVQSSQTSVGNIKSAETNTDINENINLTSNTTNVINEAGGNSATGDVLAGDQKAKTGATTDGTSGKPSRTASADDTAEDAKEPDEDQENTENKEDKAADEAEKEDDGLDALFDDDSKAFSFNEDNEDVQNANTLSNTEADDSAAEEGANKDTKSDEVIKHGNDMSADEMAAIEEELAAAAERRMARLSNLDSVQRLQKIAELPLKEIPPMHDFVDALWGLTSVSASKDIVSYQEMVKFLKDSYEKNEKLPQFLMGIVGFEPQEDDVLNRTVIDAIKSMIEVYCIIGYGPRSVKYAKPETLAVKLKTLISSTDQVLGLGVLGLDMHYAAYTLDQQQVILDIQLKLATELGLMAYINSEKADDQLCEFLQGYDKQNLPKLVYAGLLTSDKIAQAVADHDMHICLRPELTYEANAEALARTKAMNSVRWLPSSGMPHSAPALFSGQWNHIKYIPETLSKFYAKQFGDRDPDEFISLCVSNWARLLFSAPLEKEKAGKEDIWADFDPDKKLF